MGRWPWQRKIEVVVRETPEARLWREFEERVVAAGLRPRNCGQGHWRIEGGLNDINWYPFSVKRTIYVNNTVARASIRGGGMERAIAAANDPGAIPMVPKQERAPRGKNRGWRRQMLAFRPFCHWCRTRLDEKTATTDHLVPIARGGTDDDDNKVLSCSKCNQARGHGVDWQQGR